MEKSSYQLSVFFEIASLPIETTQEEICENVLIKLTRVFLANRSAIIIFTKNKPKQIFSYGFRQGTDIYKKITSDSKHAFTYKSNDILIYAEKKIPFSSIQLKFLTILSDRLVEILQMQKTKKTLREAENIEALFSTIPDPIIIIDEKNKILEVNQKLLQIIKTNKNIILQKKLHNFKTFDLDSQKKLKQKCFFNTKGACEVFVLLNKQEKCYEINATEVNFKGKKAYLLIFRDITKRKEIDQIKSEFISITSHQLRTPVSGIKWLSELLINGRVGKLAPEQSELVKNIIEYNKRMIHLIDELLDISTMKNKKTTIYKKKFPIHDLMEELMEDNERLIKTNKLNLIFNKKLKNFIILADKEKIRQVFENLIDNSVKYVKGKPKITISWKKIKNEIQFKVKDNGIGIAKEDQSKIFNAFFRAKNAIKLDLTRAGLGLFVVKTILDSFNGKIWFESKLGEGTTFHFALPLAKEQFDLNT